MNIPYIFIFMEIILKKPKSDFVIQEIDEDQRLQYINASSNFNSYQDAIAGAKAVRGGMFWKTQNGKEYLIRTSANNAQKSLGLRTPETEAIYDKFKENKARAEAYVKHYKDVMDTHKRMNRALYVGRTPQLVVNVLNTIRDRGLDEFFTVVGTHAIFAYESAAGVRINNSDALATRDVDFLFDTRKRLNFMTAMKRLDSSMLGILQSVDPSFRLHHEQKYTAINKDGFEVDFIRREVNQTSDEHPMRLTAHEDDFWVAQAKRAGILLDSEPFSTMVVSASGDMAKMKTINPVTFAKFKRWMAEFPDRDILKKPRDKRQAEIVEEIAKNYFPHLLNPNLKRRTQSS